MSENVNSYTRRLRAQRILSVLKAIMAVSVNPVGKLSLDGDSLTSNRASISLNLGLEDLAALAYALEQYEWTLTHKELVIQLNA